MNKLNTFFVLALGALLGIGGFIYAIHGFHNLHITAVFEELEPFKRNINVYYKGFKLGRSVRVYPSKDFKYTNVDIILNAKNLNLPDNVTAKIKRKDKKDYIEIDYPDRPSIKYIKNHAKIEGKKGVSLTEYIDRQADGGGLDEIKENLNDTVISAGETLEALTGLFNTANEILVDLKPALKESSDNLVKTTRNLTETTDNFAQVSRNLNSSAKPETLDNTFNNLELITKNLEQTTSNTSTLIQRTDRETVALINCLIHNINLVVLNVNDIVKGFKATLSKKFAGMRLVFGAPLSK